MTFHSREDLNETANITERTIYLVETEVWVSAYFDNVDENE